MTHSESTTRREAFRTAVMDLRQAGIENALVDAMVLLGHATGTEAEKVLLKSELQLTKDHFVLFSEMIERRCRHETVSRIIGSREFMSLNFRLSPDVLDPRPETELLVERAVQFLKSRIGPQLVLDIGTGSGAIAVSLAVYVPGVRVLATDLSDRALRLAAINVREHQVEDQILMSQMDLAGALKKEPFLDLVVSNPPYVTEKEYEGLPAEVRDGDPKLALVAGTEGTEIYPLLADQAAARLRPGGALMVEVGAGQAAAVAAVMGQCGFQEALAFKDLAGIDRVVVGIMEDG